MHKVNEKHADKARQAIAVCAYPQQELKDSVRSTLIGIGHLCDAENIDFIGALKRAINAWAVERIDPNSVAGGPIVEITIGTEGLPPALEPVKRPDRHNKSRPA